MTFKLEIENKRRYSRKMLAVAVEYTLSKLESYELKKVHGKGMTTDISEKGLGITTDFPLEPGHVLVISNNHKSLFEKIAIVRWTMSITGSYRVGLEFV